MSGKGKNDQYSNQQASTHNSGPNSGKNSGQDSGQDSVAGPSTANIRWIDLTAEQKKKVIRMRNAESARKSRQNRREKDAGMKERWEQNEKKIEDLEKLVDQLTNEIQPKLSPESRARAESKSGSKNKDNKK